MTEANPQSPDHGVYRRHRAGVKTQLNAIQAAIEDLNAKVSALAGKSSASSQHKD